MKSSLIVTIVLLNLTTLRLFVEAVPPLLAEEPKRYRYEPEIHEDSADSKLDDVDVYYRLPDSLVPTEYTIRILPIMDETPEAGVRFTAPGSVTIAVDCTRDTNVITLHSFLVNITGDSITVKDVEAGTFLSVGTWDHDPETHFHNITTMTANPLLAGKKYEIYMDYVAPVSIDRANGLYRATYFVPGDSEPRYMAGTQLEPARARQVFPCFDEPRWKSIYRVTIGRNSNYLSVANGDIVNVERHETLPDYYWDTFEATPLMPTYLFAIAVADYAYIKASSEIYRLPVGIYAARHLILGGSGDYAAEASARIMKLFEDLYQVDHPMTKVDSIVVPGKGGAMENWGLVTYGNFLMKDGETTESQRQGLVSIISHELAHQWFGNLVTCEWWSDIWLNEGFATYVSYIGMEQHYNEFEPRKWILPDAVQNAFKLDAAASSHPIVASNVNTLPEIDRHFSSLQYDKGASLIRMMEGFLTQDTLDKGLRRYLQRMADKVAVQDQLFQDLNDQALEDGALPANKNVKDIMDTWTLQKGFPLVRVSRAGSSRVYLSQERFINSATRMLQNPLDFDPNHLWEVPISVATKADPNFGNYTPKTWIDRDVILTSMDADTTQWIMINNEGTGFYRVLYDVQLTNLILEQLNTDSTVISPLARSQLLDDYINLAYQEYVSIESALRLTQYLAVETDFTVWNGLLTNLRSTFNVLSGTPAFDSFSAYFELRIAAALKLIEVRQPSDQRGQVVILRNNLLDWACALGNLETSDCGQYAKELLAQWQATPETNPYPIDLQAVLYCASVASGSTAAFDFVLGRYSATTSETQKTRLVSALACTRDAALLDRLLELTLTSPLTLADSITVRGRVAGNSLGRAKAFAFLQNNLQQIISYHGNAVPVGTLATTLSTYYGSQQEADALQKFINDNSEDLASVRTTLDNAVTAVRRNIVWMSKFYNPLKTWFEAQTSQVPAPSSQ